MDISGWQFELRVQCSFEIFRWTGRAVHWSLGAVSFFKHKFKSWTKLYFYFKMPTQTKSWSTNGAAITRWTLNQIWHWGKVLIWHWHDWRLKFRCSFSQFDLISFRQQNLTFTRREGDFSTLQVSFNLQRHTGYFLIQVLNKTFTLDISWVPLLN